MDTKIGLLLFENITQLDLSGPYEVFSKFPDTAVYLVSSRQEPVTAFGGMRILPTVSYEDCPDLDVVCVPGGPGVNRLLTDESTLEFIRQQSQNASYITSVCTGALVLGAAGLLKGRRATTHWMSHDMLELLGAIPVKERVVKDGNIITGGGVTAGIDFALSLAVEMFGKERSQSIQLALEYDPSPPFQCGSPRVADSGLVVNVRESSEARQREREACVRKAALKI